jgi:hypothetical protein
MLRRANAARPIDRRHSRWLGTNLMSLYYSAPASDHFNGTRFFDPQTSLAPRSRWALLRWLIERRSAGRREGFMMLGHSLVSVVDDDVSVRDLQPTDIRALPHYRDSVLEMLTAFYTTTLSFLGEI